MGKRIYHAQQQSILGQLLAMGFHPDRAEQLLREQIANDRAELRAEFMRSSFDMNSDLPNDWSQTQKESFMHSFHHNMEYVRNPEVVQLWDDAMNPANPRNPDRDAYMDLLELMHELGYEIDWEGFKELYDNVA